VFFGGARALWTSGGRPRSRFCAPVTRICGAGRAKTKSCQRKDVRGSASRVRDQLALPRRDASPEEVLLRLRELQSGYELNVDIGLTYSFGSIFNNIVNPRFGR